MADGRYLYNNDLDVADLITYDNQSSYHDKNIFPYWNYNPNIHIPGQLVTIQLIGTAPTAIWHNTDNLNNYNYKCQNGEFVKRGYAPTGRTKLFASHKDFTAAGGYYYFLNVEKDSWGDDCLKIRVNTTDKVSTAELIDTLGNAPSRILVILQGAGGAGGPCRGYGDGCGGYGGALCPCILDLDYLKTSSSNYYVIYTGKGGEGYDSNYKGKNGQNTTLAIRYGSSLFPLATAMGGRGGDPAKGTNYASNDQRCAYITTNDTWFCKNIWPVQISRNSFKSYQWSDGMEYATYLFGAAGGVGGVPGGRNGQNGESATRPDISLGPKKACPFYWGNSAGEVEILHGGYAGYEGAGGGGGGSYFGNGGNGGNYDRDGEEGGLGAGGGGGGYAVTVLHPGGNGGDGLFMLYY